jgi:hypothetical protein
VLDWILLGGSDIQLGAVDFFAAEAKAEAGADADAGAVQEANNGTTWHKLCKCRPDLQHHHNHCNPNNKPKHWLLNSTRCKSCVPFHLATKL